MFWGVCCHVTVASLPAVQAADHWFESLWQCTSTCFMFLMGWHVGSSTSRCGKGRVVGDIQLTLSFIHSTTAQALLEGFSPMIINLLGYLHRRHMMSGQVPNRRAHCSFSFPAINISCVCSQAAASPLFILCTTRSVWLTSTELHRQQRLAQCKSSSVNDQRHQLPLAVTESFAVSYTCCSLK